MKQWFDQWLLTIIASSRSHLRNLQRISNTLTLDTKTDSILHVYVVFRIFLAPNLSTGFLLVNYLSHTVVLQHVRVAIIYICEYYKLDQTGTVNSNSLVHYDCILYFNFKPTRIKLHKLIISYTSKQSYTCKTRFYAIMLHKACLGISSKQYHLPGALFPEFQPQ